MVLNAEAKTVSIGNKKMHLFVPDAATAEKYYRNNKDAAYWTKLWPASIGLCSFIDLHPKFIAGKHVLELAAGLGLPGIFAAALAKHVHITDISTTAVELLRENIQQAATGNISCSVLDWNDIKNIPLPELVLLSDVNYQPEQFNELFEVINYLLQHKVTVIISTPQRLVAKDFINMLLPFSSLHWQTMIEGTGVSVFVLEK